MSGGSPWVRFCYPEVSSRMFSLWVSLADALNPVRTCHPLRAAGASALVLCTCRPCPRCFGIFSRVADFVLCPLGMSVGLSLSDSSVVLTLLLQMLTLPFGNLKLLGSSVSWTQSSPSPGGESSGFWKKFLAPDPCPYVASRRTHSPQAQQAANGQAPGQKDEADRVKRGRRSNSPGTDFQ